MRKPRWGGRCASQRPSRLGTCLTAFVSLGSSLSNAITFSPVPSPNLDLSNLGRIGVAGDFSGLSLYQYSEQSGEPVRTNGSQSLLAMLPNGDLGTIVSTDASIRTMCTFAPTNGGMGGVVLGGNFTSLDGTESTAVALFDPTSSTITPLAGLEGQVNALLCDNGRNTVYVGGNFKGANSTNAIAWYSTAGWTNLPFAGFNGPVDAIAKASNGHIIFGGQFTGLGNATSSNVSGGQTINLSTANITAQNSASTTGFSDPANIVCASGQDTAGNTWLAQDNTPASWDAQFGFGFEPTKLRLWNTRRDGRGTKTFRFIARPLNGILQLTYTDPTTGKNATCYNECPLSNDTSIPYQDFQFVRILGMNSFTIAISDWYGDGAGLAGIELFENNDFSYAIDSFNEPKCRTPSLPSSSSSTGPWKESPSFQSSSKYLIANLTGKTSSQSASVVFMPNIKESGNYSVNMYTPGCVPDNTCSTRGRVNITGVMSSSSTSSNLATSLYQTNDYDKYDQIYFGYIEKTSDSFKSTITLTPLDGQDTNSLTIVAQRVGYTLINSTGGLNGLFDFNPDQAVVNVSDFKNSTIDTLGSSFHQKSAVKSLVSSDGVTYVGGNFTSNENANIVAIDDNNVVKTLDGGLNGQVLSMFLQGEQLYLGGDFNDTSNRDAGGLSHVAVYNSSQNSIAPLGAGVNGRVYNVVPMQINITGMPEIVMTFSGTFTQCNAFGSNAAVPVDGLAIWVPSKKNWLQNLSGSIPSYSGVLTAALVDLSHNNSIYAGSLASAVINVNGAATLDHQGLGNFPVKIQAQPPSSGLQRRQVLSISNSSGVETGMFYEEDGQNITVLAGHFAAASSNGTTVNNLVIIDGNNANAVTGLGANLSDKSTVLSVDVQGTVLYAGGKITGRVHGNDITGIVAYDLANKSFISQPPSVSGGNGTVFAVSAQPKSENIFIGGSFTRAGALDCPGVCMYNTENAQWSQPGSQLAGDVRSLLWTSNTQLIAGGDMKGNGSQTLFLALYDTEKDTWTAYPGAGSIPGPVHVITPASSSRTQIWVGGTSLKDGSVFLMKYDGSKWMTAAPSLPAGSDLRSLQVFKLTKNHNTTDIMDDDEILMLTGSIVIPSFGSASAAIYNGTSLQPYVLTTSPDNSLGSIARFFTENDAFFQPSSHHLAVGFIVLIGLAIALGLILLLVIAGVVLDHIRKKREGYIPAPTSMYDKGSGIQRIPPHELLQSLGRSRPGAPQI